MDYAVLRTEVLPDPLARGYSGMTDAQIAVSLNTVNRSRIRSSMSGDEVFATTNAAEFSALTANSGKPQMWVSFCSRGDINPGGAANIAFVQYIFGAGSQTVSALNAARTETVSRATELGLPLVTGGHVTAAKQ